MQFANRLAVVLFVLVFAGLALLGWRWRQGAVWHDGGRSAALSVATRPPSDCIEAARLFGQIICEQELAATPADSGQLNPQFPVPAGPDATRQKTVDNLRNLIWRRALFRRFGAAALTPTAAEVAHLRAVLASRLEDNYQADKQLSALIDTLLARNVYLPDNQAKLRSLQKTLDLSVRLYEARRQQTADLPAPYHFVSDAAETKLARDMVATWRADKALYEAYGGRLLRIEAEFEPIDAYGKFLDYIQKDGRLKISDAAARDALQPIRALAASQPDAPENPIIAREYFRDPTWRFSYIGGSQRLEAMRTQLLALPSLGPKGGLPVPEQDMIGKSSLPASP